MSASVADVLLADVNHPQHAGMMDSINDRDIQILQWLRDNQGAEGHAEAVAVLLEAIEVTEHASEIATEIIGKG